MSQGDSAVEEYCGACGHTLRREYHFCPNCGMARPSPPRSEVAPAPTFTPEEILASFEEEEGNQDQAVEAPPVESGERVRETAPLPPTEPDYAVPPPSANDPVALPPPQDHQAGESRPEASEANNAGFRIEHTSAWLLGALGAVCLLVIWLAAGAPVAVLALIIVVALVRYAYKKREEPAFADTEAEVAPPPAPPPARATRAQAALDEPPWWAKVGGLVCTGALIFGVCLWLGLNPGTSLAAGIISLALAGIGMERERIHRSARTVPRHSRSIPQWVKIAVATRDGGKCQRCGSPHDLQFDHIIPYSRGGSSTDPSNIQLLCGRCNRLKSNRYVG